ncbi:MULTISPECIES: ABC transporter permease [unclassified Saccharopolyspora]|uniref:ABC transporter permease n=1 Tax=unclassified Saccharopolyspora TaxID=2646250 RepID=UPI001CD668F3|nr:MULTISPECIES: ABC transporter permease subunit [unclassified Saccharopolyspora]MCA1186762.1 ABC transporter permease subunit [Saccharopolyspora sp. 6T]MCA1193006.1 ABC transporter permease subunit [Saccharopolyspora sp. 6V]MCA1226576.1 ABC transporter permease subunit [Saccharopolyspora sp. 6M]MCA1281999.1 ABC transporter permease subunit [Saccharopolyspora sp. 7B]
MTTTTAPERTDPAAPPATAPPAGPGAWRRIAAAGWPPAAFALLLGAGWQLMAVLADSVLVPGLGEIADRFGEIVVGGDVLGELGVTLARVCLGFALAFAAALVVGIAMGRHPVVRRFFEPAVLLGLTVPGLVWALLCVIWFGVGLANPVLAVALSAAPALTLNVYQGIRALPGELLEMTHVYRFSPWRRLRYLWLPALQPALFSGARLGLSLSWKVIVLVEIFGLSSGVGYQLNNEFAAQSVAGVLSWTLLFGAVMALLEYGLLQNLERRLTRWRKAVSV